MHQKQIQTLIDICGRANPSKTVSCNQFSLSWSSSKISHPLQRGCRSRLSVCQCQPKQLQIQRRQCCLHCSESIHFTTFSTDLKKINFPIPVLRPTGFWPLQWKRPFSNFPQLLNFLPWLFLSLFRCQQSTAMEATHDKALIAAASTALANVFVKTLMKYLYINIQCIINVYYTLYINICTTHVYVKCIHNIFNNTASAAVEEVSVSVKIYKKSSS